MKQRGYAGRVKALVEGNLVYTDDFEVPGMLHAVFVGSPYAHAKIRAVNVSQATRLPGVVTVITGEVLKECMDPLPPTSNFSVLGWHWRIPEVYALAVDKVRFFGEPVALVVAESERTALLAAEEIAVEYELLEPVLDPLKALEPGAPLIYPEWGDNVQVHLHFEWGDIEAAFKEADFVLPVSWREGRVSGFPIEPRGCVAVFDRAINKLTLVGTFQTPWIARHLIAKTLRIPEARVEVRALEIGGAFGNKINCWKQAVVALASMITGRPVKWFETTREFVVTGPHQRDVIWQGKVAATNDGRILGVDVRFVQDLGVEGTNRGSAAMSIVPACAAVANAYKLKAARIEAFGVVTNKSFYCAYRGYGKDKGIKFIERVIEKVARHLNMDPLEVRRRNFISQNEFLYRQISGYVYDAADYSSILNRATQLLEIDRWREAQEKARKEGRYLGIGCAFCVEPAGVSVQHCVFSGLTEARVRMNVDGSVEVWTDRTEIGQGGDVTIAEVVSGILGIETSNVVVHKSTSDIIGCGPISSRGAVYCLSAVAKAADELKRRIKRIAAWALEAPEDLIVLEEGYAIDMRDSSRRISLKEVAARCYLYPGPRALPRDIVETGDYLLDVLATWYSPNTMENPGSTYTTYCASCDMCVVEVQPDGHVKILKYVHVHDAGKTIDFRVLDGQIKGGIVQGLGEAITERLVYDDNGQLLTQDYTDYVLPTAADVPQMVVAHEETPTPYTVTGAKGMGEAPIIGAKVAVINAVEDAIRPLGVEIDEAPICVHKLGKLLLSKKYERRD